MKKPYKLLVLGMLFTICSKQPNTGEFTVVTYSLMGFILPTLGLWIIIHNWYINRKASKIVIMRYFLISYSFGIGDGSSTVICENFPTKEIMQKQIAELLPGQDHAKISINTIFEFKNQLDYQHYTSKQF